MLCLFKRNKNCKNEEKSLKLKIDTIPETAWFSNLRSELPVYDWDIIRKKAYKDAGYACTICGIKAKMHAHEIWEFDEEKQIQKLLKVAAVCPDCHQVIHFGLASAQGKFEEAKAHFLKINQCSERQFELHYGQAYGDWARKSLRNWKLDLSILDDLGLVYLGLLKEKALKPKPKAYKSALEEMMDDQH